MGIFKVYMLYSRFYPTLNMSIHMDMTQ